MICRTLFLVLTLSATIQTSLSVAQTPADHLVPPPLPIPQFLAHSKTPTYAPPLPPLQDEASLGSHIEQQQQSGFMTRIARWFGYGSDATAGPREQQLVSSSNVNSQFTNPTGKQAYSYPNPKQQQQQQQNGKAPCHLCNKYPWVPMLPPGIQYPLSQQYQQTQSWPQPQQNIEAQASLNYHQSQPASQPVYNQPSAQLTQQYLPVKQRAVQFQFPSFNNVQSTSQNNKLPTKSRQYPQRPAFSPIPFPSLSASAIPPLYDAQPFRQVVPTTQSPFTKQQLPSTEPAHFAENIGAHSELQPDRVIPAQLSNTNGNDASFEIVKSHQLTDFVSSVEYPASYVQSPAIDLDGSRDASNQFSADTNSANTVKYQHEHLNVNLSQHVPASQILTELGNFGEPQQVPQESTTLSPIYEETTSQYTPQFESQLLVLNNQQQSEAVYEGDNFPSASSHNITAIQQNFNNDYDFSHSTPEPYTTQPILPTNLEFSTQSSQQSETRYITDHFQNPSVEFVPSLQTEYFQQQVNIDTTRAPVHRNRERGRETPKRLLDAPIHHNSGSSAFPRPFTRDFNELDVRLGALNYEKNEFQHPNHAYTDLVHSTLLQMVTPVPPITVSAAAPTPTSTYSAIDASGHFAGMSPPAPPPPPAAQHKGPVHQIVVPYTTKNRPRPFKQTRGEESTTPSFEKWSHAQDADNHQQEESMLVSSATEAPTPPRRTTKYLTKILASNLRDLLQREHEVKNNSNRGQSLSFDVSKLQKNIDDWTEQEYTSLSHRPSTPTIRGRSKHIPTEYLTTTTPATRRAKTTQAFDAAELSASINNLEPLLMDRGSKRFEFVPIDDNSLLDFYDATTTSTTTETAPTKPKDLSKQFVPFYIRAVPTQEPTELWQKARVSISPQTKEKIYVVTPQPRFFPQRVFVENTEKPQASESSDAKGFKSPRFLVRPTPGNGTAAALHSRGSTPDALYTPDLFGLMGLSAYVPAEPVEIIDGNSKVITIVTPASGHKNDNAKSLEDLSSQKNRPKSTMSPSPR